MIYLNDPPLLPALNNQLTLSTGGSDYDVRQLAAAQVLHPLLGVTEPTVERVGNNLGVLAVFAQFSFPHYLHLKYFPTRYVYIEIEEKKNFR